MRTLLVVWLVIVPAVTIIYGFRELWRGNPRLGALLLVTGLGLVATEIVKALWG